MQKHLLHDKALLGCFLKEKSRLLQFFRVCLYFLDTVYPSVEYRSAKISRLFFQEIW